MIGYLNTVAGGGGVGGERGFAPPCTPRLPSLPQPHTPRHPRHPPTWSMSPYSCASLVSKYLLRLKSLATCRGAGRGRKGREAGQGGRAGGQANGRHEQDAWAGSGGSVDARVWEGCRCHHPNNSTPQTAPPPTHPTPPAHLIKGLPRGLRQDVVHVVADAQQLARLAVDVAGLQTGRAAAGGQQARAAGQEIAG